MSAKERLTIQQWNTQTGRVVPEPKFVAMLNPAKYARARTVSYTNEQPDADGTMPEKRIDRISVDTLDLDELVLDGTGIVDAPTASASVDEQLDALRRVLHGEDDPKVRHAVVEVGWGSLLFQGRLTSMAVSYTLFGADGTPLRARVKLSFVAYEKSSATPARTQAAPQARQIRLVDGDNLPLLCFKAYDDPSLYQAVALSNDLTSIRRLQPGALLTLPKMA